MTKIWIFLLIIHYITSKWYMKIFFRGFYADYNGRVSYLYDVILVLPF